MYNKISLIGHVGKDIEIQEVQGKFVGRFSLATSESYKDANDQWQDKVEWHTIVAWRKTRDQLQNVKKGAMYFIEGKQTHRQYDDKEGNKRYVSEVISSTMKSLDKRKKEDIPMPTEQPY